MGGYVSEKAEKVLHLKIIFHNIFKSGFTFI